MNCSSVEVKAKLIVLLQQTPSLHHKRLKFAVDKSERCCRCLLTAPLNWILIQWENSRRSQIYCWIKWQHWERLTGHSSWRALVQRRARTGLLCFDFLSWQPWRMSYGEGGGDAATHHHKPSPLSAQQFSHTWWSLNSPPRVAEVDVMREDTIKYLYWWWVVQNTQKYLNH